MTDGFLDQSAMDRLDAASEWLIQFGRHAVRENGKDWVAHALVGNYLVSMTASPLIDTNVTLTKFLINARGFHHDVEVVFREGTNDGALELWQLRKYSDHSATRRLSESVFFVTETNPDGTNAVHMKSPQFIAQFTTQRGQSLVVPQDRLDIAYKLQAWRFPEAFPNSHLKDWVVDFDAAGQLIATPVTSR